MNGNYTKHIYIGSQRIVSKLGDLDSYGPDPRRIEYAGANVDGAKVDYKTKYTALQQTIKDRYGKFEVPYYGKDNDDYVNGQGFCCDDNVKKTLKFGVGNDNAELYQYYYHSDHLGSSSLITNLDGEVVQHIEYVPFGEVFIEERNNTWNTPYLFNAKELDEETGNYFFGKRYYDPRISLWLSPDLLQEKYPNISTYAYCAQNPVIYIDPDGSDWIYSYTKDGKLTYKDTKVGTKIYFTNEAGQKVLFENVNLVNTYERTMFKDIIGHLLASVKVEGADDLKQWGYSPKYPKSGAAAYTVPKKNMILLNTNRTISSELYDLQSTFRHEYLHLKMPTETYFEHAEVYKAQMTYPEFAKASEGYKVAIIAGYALRLLNAAAVVSNPDKISDSLDDFNKNVGKKFGATIVPVMGGPTDRFGLDSFKIKINGKQYPVNYRKLTNTGD